MASPSPVPPYLRLVDASACWNASKMIFCFSSGMPMPVSETSKRHDRRTPGSAPDGWRSSRPDAADTFSRTPPCAVNLKALDSRFFSTCCRRFESVVMVRPRLGSRWTSNDSCRVSASWRNGRATMSSRLEKKISSASTVTVPDSIFDRSRISLIRLSRSVPAPWMVRANSTCFGRQDCLPDCRSAAGRGSGSS